MEIDEIIKVCNLLSSDESIATAGFMLGFLHRFKFNKKTLDKPLSTFIDASINGCSASIGALFASMFLPYNLRFIVSVTSICATIHYKIKDIKELD